MMMMTSLDSRIERVCASECAAIADITRGCPLRAVLIRTGSDRYRFVLTFHHIVLDGWSLPILLHEILAGYHGQPLPAAVPYRDFVAWLHTRDRANAHTTWRDLFSGFTTPTLVGPPDLLRSTNKDVATFTLSGTTTEALSALARTHHSTVSTVLQAAWAQLLGWLTGHHDVAFGITVSGAQPIWPGRTPWLVC